MKSYKTLDELMLAKDHGKVPASFVLILDNDSVHGKDIIGSGKIQFRSDPATLLRDLLDYVGLAYDEA